MKYASRNSTPPQLRLGEVGGPAVVDVRCPDQLERLGGAAALRQVGRLEQAGARVEQRGLRCRHVGAGQDPRQPGVGEQLVGPPALDHDHVEVACTFVLPAAGQQHAVGVAGELTGGHPVLLDDPVLADAGGEAVDQQRPPGSAADRVRSIQDHEAETELAGGDHRVVHGPDVGVEPRADVLDVEDHGLHLRLGEEAGELRRVGPVRVVDRHPGPLVHVGVLRGTGLGRAAEAVLGSEHAADGDAGGHHGVHDADQGTAEHPGRVGDHPDPLSPELPPVLGRHHVGAGADPTAAAAGRGFDPPDHRGGGQSAAADQQTASSDRSAHDHRLTSSDRCRTGTGRCRAGRDRGCRPAASRGPCSRR